MDFAQGDTDLQHVDFAENVPFKSYETTVRVLS